MSEKDERAEITCADGTKVRIADFREATTEERDAIIRFHEERARRIDLELFQKLDEAATAGPWTQWVEHGQLFAGEVKENLPYVLSGDTVQIVECFGDELADEDEDGLIPTAVSSATDDAALVAYLRNHAPQMREILAAVQRLVEADDIDSPDDIDTARGEVIDAGRRLLTPRPLGRRHR